MRRLSLVPAAALAAALMACLTPTATASATGAASSPSPTSLRTYVETLSSRPGAPWHTDSDSGAAVAADFWVYPTVPGAAWIWRTPSPLNEVVTFTEAFTVPRSARNIEGTLHITADNAYRAYLDGDLVGGGGAFSVDGPDDSTWSSVNTHSVEPRRGHNVLVVEALNYYGPAQGDNPAAVVYRLDYRYECPGRSCEPHGGD